MIFFIPLVFKMSMLPSLLYAEAGTDACLAVTFVCALEFLQLGAVLFLCSQGGMHEIYFRYGTLPYVLLSLPVLFVMVLKSIVFLAEITNYVTSFLFYNVLNFPILLACLLILFYLGYKGGRSIARLFELSVWFVPVIIVMGLIFGKANLEFEYVLPVGTNLPAAVKSIEKYLIYTFDFSPFLFFRVKVRKRRNVALFSFVSILTVTACYMLLLARYGRATFLADCAFARLASFDTVVSEVGSLDWIGGLLWVSVALLTIGLKISSFSEMGSLLHIKGYLSSMLFCILLGIFSFFVWKNQKDVLAFATSGIQYVVFGIETGIPILMILLFSLRKQRRIYAASL